MIWVEHREGEAIPEELYYDDYQTDKNEDGETALMIWIEYRYGDDIPQGLLYPGC